MKGRTAGFVLTGLTGAVLFAGSLGHPAGEHGGRDGHGGHDHGAHGSEPGSARAPGGGVGTGSTADRAEGTSGVDGDGVKSGVDGSGGSDRVAGHGPGHGPGHVHGGTGTLTRTVGVAATFAGATGVFWLVSRRRRVTG